MRGLVQALLKLLQGRTLPFAIQQQQQTNWCWSACATSASLFYDPSSTWAQCTLVTAELGAGGCCQNGSSAACNQPYYLDRALTRTGNLARFVGGRVGLDKLRTEINAGRPVAARVGWSGGGGHFVVLTGYRWTGGRAVVDVRDPWSGSTTIPLDEFASSYKGSGTWTHTYLTSG
jgi:Papain-like cysteine protease AvrRpt2